MNLIKKSALYFFLFILLMGESIKLIAHESDQLAYNFRDDGVLSIHLTPQGALDLVLYLHPQLKQDSIIRLSDYYRDYTAYFNDHIKMQIEGQPMELIFIEADLYRHDASLTYKIDGFPGNYIDFSLQLDAFTALYKSTQNHVQIALPEGAQRCDLDLETQNCEYNALGILSFPLNEQQEKIKLSMLSQKRLLFFLGLVLMIGGIWILRPRLLFR